MKFIFHLKSFHFPLLDQLSGKLIIEREGRGGGVELVAGLVTRKESQLYFKNDWVEEGWWGSFLIREFHKQVTRQSGGRIRYVLIRGWSIIC